MANYFNPGKKYNLPDPIKFDSFLVSELGQKYFPGSKASSNANSLNSPGVKLFNASSDSNIRPSPAFISQSRNSIPITSLTPSATKITIADNIDKAHIKIIKVTERMKELESNYKEEFAKLDNRITSNKRKKIFEGIKNNQKEYQMLKDDRLQYIKRNRVFKSEYPEGFKGYELHY